MSRAVAYAALAIAGGALALSIHTAVRGRGGAGERPAATVCVDADARAELAQLRRAAAVRDARTRVAAGAPSAPPVDDVGQPVEPAPAPGEAGPRRYVRFEIPNPAVTVTQADDGVIQVHTSDPALTGSVLTVGAITADGERDEMMIRVP